MSLKDYKSTSYKTNSVITVNTFCPSDSRTAADLERVVLGLNNTKHHYHMDRHSFIPINYHIICTKLHTLKSQRRMSRLTELNL